MIPEEGRDYPLPSSIFHAVEGDSDRED